MSARSEWRDGDRTRLVELTALEGDRWRAVVDGVAIELAAEALGDGRLRLTHAGGVTVAEVSASGARHFVRIAGTDVVLDRESAARKRSRAAAGGSLESPMPGVVTRVMVAVGDAVTAGQPLLAIEAMKMEHLIRAPHAGTVTTLGARPGEMVAGGVALVALSGAPSGG